MNTQTGFTMVELVMVIIILGIVGVYVAPRILTSGDVSAEIYQNRAISILRNMQTRAMQDTRNSVTVGGQSVAPFCYQVNFQNTQFGIPVNVFSTEDNAGNDPSIATQNLNRVLASCATNVIDTVSDPAQLYYVTGTDAEGISISATASRQTGGQASRPTISAIRFDKLGRAVGRGIDSQGLNVDVPCSGIDFPGGCYINFSGQSNATVCVESQGYIYACGS